MMQDNLQERFPIVDDEGHVVGAATRGECHNGSRLLHPVVHLHVFNPTGEVYLQKRPAWKDIQPGKWDTSVGGHMDYGKTPNYLRTLPLHLSQRTTTVTTDYTDFSFDIRPTADFLGQLLTHADGLEILQPQELRDRFQQQVESILQRYQK